MKARLIPMTANRVHRKIVVLRDLRKKNERLEKECISLRSRLDTATKTKRELEDRLSKSKSIISELREELANVKEENALMKKQNKKMQSWEVKKAIWN